MKSYSSYLLLNALLAASPAAQAQGVTCTPDRIAFAESVAVGGASAPQAFTVAAQGLSGSIVVQPGSQVEVSAADSGYSREPLTLSADELAGGKTLYVRFAPACSGFADSAISTSVMVLGGRNELLGSVAVSGVMRTDGATGGRTFKVATFNAEWLACPSNGPDDDSLQMLNVATLISRMDADVVALQEVTFNPNSSIDTVLEHLGSGWGGVVEPHSLSRCAQSEAIIYKKSRISLTGAPRLMTDAGEHSAWASGRYPVEFNLELKTGSRSLPITLINLHAKAYGDAESYLRRCEASQGLKTLLDGGYADRNLIVLGDYNDDVDASTYRGQPSPYKNFADDSLRYRFLTSPLSANLSLIDHIMISDELQPFYLPGSAQLETAVSSTIPDYAITTSDHTPVSATFAFGEPELDVPVADHYTARLADVSFDMPNRDSYNRPLHYAIDSGVAVSLDGAKLTLRNMGLTRMVAWRMGSVTAVANAKFFYVQVTDRSVAPQITAHPVGQEVAPQEKVVFMVQATGTQLRYQWKKNGRNIAGATTLRYAINRANSSHAAYYSCEVSNELGSEESQAARICVGDSCPAIAATAVAPQSAFERRLMAYPNPARQSVTVASAAGRIASLRVSSIGGAVVYEQTNVHAPTITIPTAGWSAGIYVITATSEGGARASIKILVNSE